MPGPNPGSDAGPDPEGERRTLVVEGGEGERVDAWLAGRMELSRTRIARLIADGRVRVDGETPRKSDRVEAGQRIEVRIPAPEPMEAVAQDLPLEVLYEDRWLLVVNKAAGMVVHPAPGHPRGTLVNALLHHVDDLSGIGGTLRPGIVHRLDKDTSGALVVAKEDRTHRELSEALKRREVKRRYAAISWGHLPDSPVTVDAPVGRDPGNRKKMAVVEEGRRAVTRIRVRESWPAAELLDVSLETGRTHQIRVHLAHLGHPVVGDETYGAGWGKGMSGPIRGWARELMRRVPRQFLHARELVFRHPRTGEEMRCRAPLPRDLSEPLEWARAHARL